MTSRLDQMTEELRQMSCNNSTDDKHLTEPDQRWLAVDRSGVGGAGSPWDGVAYINTRKCMEWKGQDQQQTRPKSRKLSSLNVERGSNV